ncbi:hypothetical protein BT67DRAFT_440996 [Trichocladium antarcticum]|uniref:Uncharacterized protein n=1 Tax=Trichocladium antarcticum TaxID=1450529 RepID=A0AAN6ZF97_9PEZI|nr:hypothetical protein BT67DRAFT_440996 [Trichocladium antarcticum]
MAISRALPTALGMLAWLPTTGTLAILIILARSPADRASSVRATAIVAAAFETTILVGISVLTLSHLGQRALVARLGRLGSLWLAAGLVSCTVGAIISVSSLICLSRVVDDSQSTVLGSKATDFLVGSSVALGLAFASQLVFLVFHFVAGQADGQGIRTIGYPHGGCGRCPPPIKSIPYHETSPVSVKVRGASFESPTPPGSSGGRSTAETMTSIRSSFSQAMLRPVTSRTRLLPVSQRSSRRPASLDLAAALEMGSRSTDEGFDSWDTSAVDPQNRQTVLESSSPPAPLTRFLETIPASPTTSRSPSPGMPLGILEPPRTRQRTRSSSPASIRTIQAQRASFTQQVAPSESHIHPLFRSSSQTPPPIATPGTVVIVPLNGGQTLSDRHSIRSIKSMRRMRSGSQPTVPSPLSRATSLDSLHQRAGSSSPGIREEDEAEAERKMTPPIPDWILPAGSMASLTTYDDRQVQTPENETVGTGAGQQR